jgi:hypothetical protein
VKGQGASEKISLSPLDVSGIARSSLFGIFRSFGAEFNLDNKV